VSILIPYSGASVRIANLFPLRARSCGNLQPLISIARSFVEGPQFTVAALFVSVLSLIPT
jgi:hypothetical protein